MTVRVLVLAAALGAAAGPAAAQQKEPISRYVVDLRGASVGLPTAPGWTPTPLPAATILPSRAIGFEAGGHVFFARARRITFGAGATIVRGSGTQTPPDTTSAPGATPAPQTVPDVTTTMTVLAPHLSMNFGHRMGWSYVSAGIVSASVESEARLGTARLAGGPESRARGFHFGGGARWFVNDRLAVNFDLRWHQLGSMGPDGAFPGARRQRMLVAGAGVSLR